MAFPITCLFTLSKLKRPYVLFLHILSYLFCLLARFLETSFYLSLHQSVKFVPVLCSTKRSLSTRVFETRTATGREHFACKDSDVSQIFIQIIPNGEKVLSKVKKRVHFRLPSASQKWACLSSLIKIHFLGDRSTYKHQ